MGRLLPLPHKEKYIENKIVAYAKTFKMIAWKFISPSQNGVPDRIFIYKGSIFFIEMKATKGRLSELQKDIIELMTGHKVSVYVCNSVVYGKAIIEAYTL